MNKQFIFLGGLPRSGSTLLCNILAQNPAIHATATSGILDEVVLHIQASKSRIESEAQGVDDERRKRQVLALMDAAYSDVDKSIVIEKSRGWISYCEMLDHLFDDFRIIVPVRDLRDVLASMEKLWRKEQRTNPQVMPSTPAQKYIQMQTIEGRLAYWMQPDQVVGLAHNRIRDAKNRGWSENLLFVTYEALTAEPEATLKAVYAHCELEAFGHDFENVEQATQENDAIYGFKDLHKIRKSVKPQEPQWPSILGDAAKPYEKGNFWQ